MGSGSTSHQQDTNQLHRIIKSFRLEKPSQLIQPTPTHPRSSVPHIRGSGTPPWTVTPPEPLSTLFQCTTTLSDKFFLTSNLLFGNSRNHILLPASRVCPCSESPAFCHLPTQRCPPATFLPVSSHISSDCLSMAPVSTEMFPSLLALSIPVYRHGLCFGEILPPQLLSTHIPLLQEVGYTLCLPGLCGPIFNVPQPMEISPEPTVARTLGCYRVLT